MLALCCFEDSPVLGTNGGLAARFGTEGSAVQILSPRLLEPRSALVLSGEARSHWKHAIPARLSDVWMNHESARTRRVSLTFRKMLKASASPE
jgi:alkylated DNA repair dioxygenase AlkB